MWGLNEGAHDMSLSRTVLIGVATTVAPSTSAVGGFFGHMARHAERHGARLVLFDPKNISGRDGTMAARECLRAHGRREWRQVECRLPDVIYENVFVHLVMRGYVRPLRELARARGIPLFNPLMPCKATLSEWVRAHPETGLRVPVTARVVDVATIDRMLDRFGVVYVKPVGGYGGRGVLRVRCDRSDRRSVWVDCDRCFERGAFRRQLSRAEFGRFVRRLLARTAYIVQEQIPLLHVDGGKVDFRTVVMRDRSGAWKLIGIVPKVAAKGGVVTNLVAGGRRMRLAQLREALGADGVSLPVGDLERCSLLTAQALTRTYPALGVIGYDLGVDAKGNVWYIELNPKPSRSLLNGDMSRASARLCAEFALYLGRRSLSRQDVRGVIQ